MKTIENDSPSLLAPTSYKSNTISCLKKDQCHEDYVEDYLKG